MSDRRRYEEGSLAYRSRYAAAEHRTYVDGNTVRQMNTVPRRRPEERPVREPRRYPHKKPVRMPGIDAVSFVFLMMALCAALYICFSYIQIQNQVHGMKDEIVSMQSSIAETKEENDQEYQDILDSVDLAEVFEKATKKLNMVQAESNQIYTYENKKSDMVKQYAEIPGAED